MDITGSFSVQEKKTGAAKNASNKEQTVFFISRSG
jgi:hypothetical protein